MKKSNDYNSIAGFYDLLGRLVYGNAIYQSQLCFLDHLPEGKNILFIGGGTGKLLDSLLEKCQPQRVVYVEKSNRMLEKSRNNCRHPLRDRVSFVHGTQDDVGSETFDIILTFYFFDQFSWFSLNRIFIGLNNRLKPEGQWLWADFMPPETCKQRFLMKMMMLFFGITTKLSTTQVYHVDHIFAKRGLIPVKEKSFYGGFIHSAMFRKPAYLPQSYLLEK